MNVIKIAPGFLLVGLFMLPQSTTSRAQDANRQ
jgi:hypothetical protein